MEGFAKSHSEQLEMENEKMREALRAHKLEQENLKLKKELESLGMLPQQPVDPASRRVTMYDETEGVEDVTESMKLKVEVEKSRKREVIEILDSSSEEEVGSDDDDDDDNDDSELDSDDCSGSEADSDSDCERATTTTATKTVPKTARPKVNRKRKKDALSPLEEDSHTTTATTANGIVLESTHGAEDLQAKVKDRIVKMLNVGLSGGSTEAEAQQAMKLAQRLMKKNNIRQVEMMKERNGGEIKTNEGTLKGGLVTVKLYNRKGNVELSTMPRWLDFLQRPVANNFGVKGYHTRMRAKRDGKARFTMTFYGIYSNCQLAAWAFKVAAEKVSIMMGEHTPNASAVILSGGSKASYTRNARMSYALGMVDGLKRSVSDNKKMEEERREARLRRARLAIKNGEAYEDSDSDEGGWGGGGGFGDVDFDFDFGGSGAGAGVGESDSDSDDDMPISSLPLVKEVKEEKKVKLENMRRATQGETRSEATELRRHAY
ncbi:hypothetical protein TL16_g06309 [Triparma laevis f. inornata]|uniref:DUF2786 domain-containing protein n=1 Tax=Triparma laevis f. inornata TaxID=1714386 RepID=A0A9W7AT24_9STRA|nr:hypothetical protein TL16_g06309 [Triparma laevis f. inornata]